jgi:rRNA small subunit pseudouridine methyltransferase Nep1
MLHLILADSELERVPAEIARHKVIRYFARKRGRRPTELLLNSSKHHPAMRKLADGERRGRPDIVHAALLQALDSPANAVGELRTYVHTRHDAVIRVSPQTRLPRAYDRFEGLIEQLFLLGAVPPGNPLMTISPGTLKELAEEIRPDYTIAMSERGRRKRLSELFSRGEGNVCVIVGGFPHGDFRSPVEQIADEQVSLFPKPLTAPAVVSRVIVAYEQARGIL